MFFRKKKPKKSQKLKQIDSEQNIFGQPRTGYFCQKKNTQKGGAFD